MTSRILSTAALAAFIAAAAPAFASESPTAPAPHAGLPACCQQMTRHMHQLGAEAASAEKQAQVAPAEQQTTLADQAAAETAKVRWPESW